jgi:hypothetical protein
LITTLWKTCCHGGCLRQPSLPRTRPCCILHTSSIVRMSTATDLILGRGWPVCAIFCQSWHHRHCQALFVPLCQLKVSSTRQCLFLFRPCLRQSFVLFQQERRPRPPLDPTSTWQCILMVCLDRRREVALRVVQCSDDMERICCAWISPLNSYFTRKSFLHKGDRARRSHTA